MYHIDRTIAGVSCPSHEAMAVIPTTVEFVHCELNAIYSEDLLRCHTGSPLDQFVSQSHRYRRHRRRPGLSSRTREGQPREMRLIRDIVSSFWTAPSFKASVALQSSLPLVRVETYSIKLHEYINLTRVDMCLPFYFYRKTCKIFFLDYLCEFVLHEQKLDTKKIIENFSSDMLNMKHILESML